MAAGQPGILVVGAGPTGLTLAAELSARGVAVRVIDRAPGPHVQSRAIGVQARTLELLEPMGLADAFVAAGHPLRRFRQYADGRPLLNLNLAHNGSKYDFILHLAQAETERLLRRHLAELGGDVEYGTQLLALRQDASAAHVTLCDAAGQESEHSYAYVVGCDGAHSRVREELGIAFTGSAYPQDWLLADVAVDGAGADDASHAYFRSDGLPIVFLPMGHGRWRVVCSNVGERAGAAPTFAEMQRLVAERAPGHVEIADPGWLSAFRCELRSSVAYRRGRGFIAGDAAHVHPPAGGQGMNTGMQDAINLAWKLALVATGRASDQLLDTYEAERRPVAAGVLGFTDRIIRWSTMTNPVKQAVRNLLVPTVTSLPAVQRKATRRLSQVAVGYPASPLSRATRTRAQPAPGERIADVEVTWRASTVDISDVLGTGRHALLLAGSGQQALPGAIAEFGDLVEVAQGTLDGRAAPGSFALVRPDGYLAVRGAVADHDRLRDYLRQLCGSRSAALSTAPPVAHG